MKINEYVREKMLNRYEKAKKLSEAKFKRLVGVKKKTFESMIKVLSFMQKNIKAAEGSQNLR